MRHSSSSSLSPGENSTGAVQFDVQRRIRCNVIHESPVSLGFDMQVVSNSREQRQASEVTLRRSARRGGPVASPCGVWFRATSEFQTVNATSISRAPHLFIVPTFDSRSSQ